MPAPATSDTIYEPVALWGRIPHGIYFKDATASRTEDSSLTVVILCR